MKIVLFEDEGFKNLLPLVYFRPVWELRCGAFTLLQKIQNLLPSFTIRFIARSYLTSYHLHPKLVADPKPEEDILFLNGRLLLEKKDSKKLLSLGDHDALVQGHTVVAWRTAGHSAEKYFSGGLLRNERVLNDFSLEESEFRLVKFPWDLIDVNGEQIVADFILRDSKGRSGGQIEEGVRLMGKENIHIASGARIMPGVVLNAEAGPLWIDEGATVMPNAVLEGPVYVGPKSRIKMGAKVYANTSIGPVCKIGGEVEQSIIQDYSNKQHEGFLGHSYLGSWVNIGADTNNSDLKNNYGEITAYINGQPVPTGKRFLGLIMGDHSKTAINTMFNTGTVVGVNCNIYGAGFPPKFIPSFSWGGSSGLREYNFEKAVEVARVVMGRRKIEFSENDWRIFTAVKDLASQIENRVRIH